MRTIFFLIFFCTISFAKAKEINIGYFELEPHTTLSKDNKEHQGIAIDYFKLLASEMKLKEYHFTQYPLKRLIHEISNTPNIDIGLILAKNPEREKLFIYAQTPLFIMKPSLVILKGKHNKLHFSKNDLKGMNICAWADGHHSEIINTSGAKKFLINGNNITSRCIELVRINRVDGFYSPDHLSISHELERLNHKSNFEVIPLKDSEVGLYTVFAKNIDSSVKDSYNKAIIKLQKENNYEDFYRIERAKYKLP